MQQTAVQLEEGADSFRNRSKIELEFRLQGAEVEEAELHGSVSGIPVSTEPSQVLGPGSRIRAPSPDRQERDEAEEAEPGMDASVDKPKAKPAKQSKSQKKAKRTPPVMPVPVKTRVELLPPVRLPALTRRNRKNTDDLDWNMEDLNAEELTLLTSVIDEDEPSSSLQSVSHDPAKERLWKSVFGLDDMSLARRVQQVLPLPQRQPLPQLLPKSGPETLQGVSPKQKPLAHLVDHPQTPRSPCRQARLLD